MNADTRQRLIESAKDLFTERGYRAVSTREIADAAGVNLGSIQYHFGSKAKLFIETVHSLMKERFRQRNFNEDFEGITRVQAGKKIVQFIRVYIEDISNPDGPDVSKLMCREINSATAENPELCDPLVQSVVDNFIRPNDSYLKKLIKVFIPDSSEEEISRFAQSIIGQCSFYATHRLFLLSLRHGRDDLGDSHRNDTINHLSRFSLRALGLTDSEITSILQHEF